MQPNFTGRSSFYSTDLVHCGSLVRNHTEKVIDPSFFKADFSVVGTELILKTKKIDSMPVHDYNFHKS